MFSFVGQLARQLDNNDQSDEEKIRACNQRCRQAAVPGKCTICGREETLPAYSYKVTILKIEPF